jgi:hypothetical protein
MLPHSRMAKWDVLNMPGMQWGPYAFNRYAAYTLFHQLHLMSPLAC